MRLSGDWLAQEGTQGLCAALTGAGYRALFVGGCVRNALMERPVADLDLATDALPEEVTRVAKAAGFRVIPTGVEHGTVTVIAGGVPHEVTTFRRDVETFGRHATVAFSGDVTEDAKRRDFTMNALYALPSGEVIDPLGGLPDLQARRVRFVGDAERRIAEDYLRILRFFRFHAIYGDPAEGLDAEGLAACAALSEGIATLSRERIGAEMRKLLGAEDPAPAVASMAQAGVLAQVLPGAEARALPLLVHLEAGRAAVWLRRLAVLGGEEAAERLRLSRAEAARLALLRDGIGSLQGPGELAYRHGAGAATDILLARAALLETPLPEGWEAALAEGAAAKLPISAADLMPALQGAALGARLREIEARWIASGFRLTREALLG
ncbi:CCA tRNA nucleotidyltransferase [Cereibacter changlensis JA139]|uniref:CCA tRNA nucleotidyltransferase n=2 Tax=Cereibacter changlensis TaxID=402884 RepID=A0A2T4K0T6_9RHOB|nr:CCA tRNA nucleotidyltransferase [Cereibacter changlensis]PTE23775.1 CCA tRNA nucleotidyltransferase [Cereibacter changlensis JA139]PZX59015.1 poly(A) polymerase [Cereibacter changlensis]